MSLKDQLKEDMKAAMKAREEGKTAFSVIRMVNSAIKIQKSMIKLSLMIMAFLDFGERNENSPRFFS